MKPYFTIDAVSRVLVLLGIDPASRVSQHDQDPQYTACVASELGAYLALYRTIPMGSPERDILACFMLESLNELIQTGVSHQLQFEVFEVLLADPAHAEELAYWLDTSDPCRDHWWPITEPLLAFRRAHAPRHREEAAQPANAADGSPSVGPPLRAGPRSGARS